MVDFAKFKETVEAMDYPELKQMYTIVCNELAIKKVEYVQTKLKKVPKIYQHKCKVCGKSWKTYKEKPMLCGHCGSRDWK